MRPSIFAAALVLLSPSSLLAAEASSCALERSVGVTEDDADAVAQFVCMEVHHQIPSGGRYRIRITKLGSKLALALGGDKGDGGYIEEQLVLSGLDEVPIATPRLVEAIAEQKHVSDTQTVTNIVSPEALTPQKKKSEMHFWMGVVGAGTFAGTGAGAQLGLSGGSDRWSFLGDLRIAGGDRFGFVSLAGGARHHFSSTDTAAYVGAGLGLDSLKANSSSDGRTGAAAYVEVGVDVMRTSTVGGAVGLRVDMPTFAVEEDASDAYYAGRASVPSRYTPVTCVTVSLRF
jgi:hypothetical protein